LAKIDRNIFYLFIGQVDPLEININALHEINKYRTEIGRFMGDMAKDTLIIFSNRENDLLINIISNIISDYEADDN